MYNNKIGLNSTLLTSLDFLTSNTQNNMLIIQIDHNTSRVVYENNFFDNKIFIEKLPKMSLGFGIFIRHDVNKLIEEIK